MSSRSNRGIPLPTHISALGIPFQVQLVEDIDGESSGVTLPDYRIIKVLDSQDTRRRWTTLLHEYFHAVLDINGVANGLNDDPMEEVIVQTMEHAVEQFMLAHGTEFLRALSVQK